MIYTLLVGHFVADFICQSDWMALNKSKDWEALIVHVAVYTMTLTVIVLIGCSWILQMPSPSVTEWAAWVGLNTAAHFVQDAITSRINAKLWQASERHWFFVGIGADQLLHYITLFVTAGWWLQ